MNMIFRSLIVVLIGVVYAGSLQANYTLFDLAKDSAHIVRGEFVELERTAKGDRLTIRCDKILKGDIAANTEITLEPFEIHKADDALGREVIVGFDLLEGVYVFNKAPFAWRSFYFEETDTAPNGLDMNEKALSAFVAINALHQDEITEQLNMRSEQQDLSYEGHFSEELINIWKVELLKQMQLKGSWAARDAAKAVVDHDLFKNRMTVAELQQIGTIISDAQVGTLGRAYMLEAIRQEASAYPAREVLIQIVREETSQSVVGKVSNLLIVDEDRAAVLEMIGSMINGSAETTQARINAMQVLLGLRDEVGVAHVHTALQTEMESADFNKDIVRAALETLRAVPSEDSVTSLEAYMESDQFINSWELRQRTWIAFARIDSEYTNAKIKTAWESETNAREKGLLKKMLEVNKKLRLIYIVHKED